MLTDASLVQAGLSALGLRHQELGGKLIGASLPKLFIDAEPGVFMTGRIRRLAGSFPNQHRVVVGGLHFVQVDSPDEIGLAFAGWLEPMGQPRARMPRSRAGGFLC